MKRLAAAVCAAFFIVGTVSGPPARAVNIEEHIYLIPAGDVDEALMRYLKRGLPDVLPMTVRIVIEPARPLPAAAYDPARGRYDAAAVLADATDGIRLSLSRERAIAVTEAPLYLGDFESVSSVADLKKGTGLLSVARLGEGAGAGLFRRRVLKQTAAAIAEALGVPRCDDAKCVNFVSDDLAAIDKEREEFCRACEKKMRKRYDNPMFNPTLPLLQEK